MKNNNKFNKKELGFIKHALEYYLINADELNVCSDCQEELYKLVDKVTEITDGKTLTEKIKESKIICN